jgi:CelD/BcsL family acetyltransferase involved in cellulose biosynthesis
MSLRVELVWDETPELLTAWLRLHALQPWPDPAQGLPYRRLIHEVFAPPGRPGCLVARREGAIVGILPVHLESRRLGPVPQRRLLGGLGWHGVMSDPLVAPGEEATVGAAFAEQLGRCSAWEAVHLWRLREGTVLPISPPHHAWHDAPTRDWCVRLDADEGPLSGRNAREMRRQLRLLSVEGSVSTVCLTDRAGTTDLARHFSTLHTALKAAQGQRQIFEESAGAHERFPEAWGELCAAGHGAAWAILLEERPVAILMELRADGVTRAWRAARDPALHRFGLGIALLDAAITASQARGDRRYELGPGEESYKRMWAKGSTPSGRWRALARGWRSLPMRAYGKLSGRSIT